MAEENNNPSPEELRRRIQERLQNLKTDESAGADKKEQPVKEETPKPQESTTKSEAPKQSEIKKEAPKSKKIELPKKEPIKKAVSEKPLTSPKTDKGEKKGNSLIIILVLLLISAIGLFTWQYLKSTDLESQNENQAAEISNLNDEKSSIQQELQSLLGDYNKLETSNEELNVQLEAERQKIEEYITQVKKLEGKAQQYDFYRRKLKELEKTKEKYIAQLDSLTTQNKMLTEENLTVKSSLEKTKGENEILAEKVALAKQVKGVNMNAEAIGAKGKPTTKAKKVTELKICITLVENPVAESGIKDIFVRIVEPKGSIMVTSADNLFETNGEEIGYTVSGQIDYQNSEIMACVKHSVPEKSLLPGNYDMEVFIDGVLIGSRNIVLF